jgi:hypothetical protein
LIFALPAVFRGRLIQGKCLYRFAFKFLHQVRSIVAHPLQNRLPNVARTPVIERNSVGMSFPVVYGSLSPLRFLLLGAHPSPKIAYRNAFVGVEEKLPFGGPFSDIIPTHRA